MARNRSSTLFLANRSSNGYFTNITVCRDINCNELFFTFNNAANPALPLDVEGVKLGSNAFMLEEKR